MREWTLGSFLCVIRLKDDRRSGSAYFGEIHPGSANFPLQEKGYVSDLAAQEKIDRSRFSRETRPVGVKGRTALHKTFDGE